MKDGSWNTFRQIMIVPSPKVHDILTPRKNLSKDFYISTLQIIYTG